MKTMEQEKRGIKRIIKIQLTVIAIIITAGGIIHVINTGNGSGALVTAIILLTITLFFGLLTYMAAMNRLGSFSDSIFSELRDSVFEIPANAKHLQGNFHYSDECISEDN